MIQMVTWYMLKRLSYFFPLKITVSCVKCTFDYLSLIQKNDNLYFVEFCTQLLQCMYSNIDYIYMIFTSLIRVLLIIYCLNGTILFPYLHFGKTHHSMCGDTQVDRIIWQTLMIKALTNSRNKYSRKHTFVTLLSKLSYKISNNSFTLIHHTFYYYLHRHY